MTNERNRLKEVLALYNLKINEEFSTEEEPTKVFRINQFGRLEVKGEHAWDSHPYYDLTSIVVGFVTVNKLECKQYD